MNYLKENKVVIFIVAVVFFFIPIDGTGDCSNYLQGAQLYYSSSYNSGNGGGGSITEKSIHLCSDGSFARNGYSETAFGGMGYSEMKISGNGNWEVNGTTLTLFWSDGDVTEFQFSSSGDGYIITSPNGWRTLPNQAQCRY